MKEIKIFAFLIFTFQAMNNQENPILYRCGVDDYNIKPIPLTYSLPKDEDRRKLNLEEFKDFHIYLYLINIKNDIIKYNLEQYEDLFIDSLNKAVETLESLLKVKSLPN